MPVLVTGAERAAGRAAADALLRAGGEVRVFLDAGGADDATADGFRRAGYKTARGTPDDEAHLELALEQVHTVAHLASSPLQDPSAVLDGVATVLSAAIGAGCRRLIWASDLGAADPRGDPWLQACAQAEELLADAPLETIVLRCALCYGADDELTKALAAGALTGRPGAATARHAPLCLRDLADAVVAADRERHGAADVSLVVPLAGPEVLTLQEFVALLGGPTVGRRTLAAGRGRSEPLPERLVALLGRDTPPPQDAVRGPTPPALGAARVRDAAVDGGRGRYRPQPESR